MPSPLGTDRAPDKPAQTPPAPSLGRPRHCPSSEGPCCTDGPDTYGRALRRRHSTLPGTPRSAVSLRRYRSQSSHNLSTQHLMKKFRCRIRNGEFDLAHKSFGVNVLHLVTHFE